MSEYASEDLRRRIERLEQGHTELNTLLKEAVMVNARLSETLLELKDEFKAMRVEMREIRDLEIDIANLKTSMSGVRWFFGTIGAVLITVAITYLFQVGQGAP